MNVRKWQYQIWEPKFGESPKAEDLERLGASGWELVSILPDGFRAGVVSFIFKRQSVSQTRNAAQAVQSVR